MQPTIDDNLGALGEIVLGNDPERLAVVSAYREQIRIAQDLVELRTSAHLSQRELAVLVGTSHSVISRLENATYEGHSLSMLRRIAQALGHRVEVRFVPLEQDAKAA